MKTILTASSCTAAVLISGIILSASLSSCGRTAPDTIAPAAPLDTSAAAVVPAPATAPPAIVLSSSIPFDVTATASTLAGLQGEFDLLSWQTFVAANWPVLNDGKPDPSKQPGQDKDNATVWETWRESSTIFLPNGAAPAPWGSPSTPPSFLPAAGRDLLAPGIRVLTQIGKTPGLLTESTQPFSTGPLIDQNGRYAHFEILVNDSMFNTIFSQKLYSRQGQQGVKNIVFECGGKILGAIMVKAAWKTLSEAEIMGGRFHTVRAVIHTPKTVNPPVEEKCELATVGLVGIHLVHKTVSAPQWIWSTFEHIDNCPTDGLAANHPGYSFYNKDTPAAAINTPPDRPWNPNNIEPPERRPQIVRMLPIDEATQRLNASWQAALRAVNPLSVWQYYQLVSTQWPTAPASSCDVASSAPTNMSGTPAPQFLGNTTLESYIQGKVPNVSSSCIECHLNATTTTSMFSDFTYLLQRAQ